MLISLQKGIIYGPIKSRRLGLSLGINLLPGDMKICPFNCIYCQYGYTTSAGFKMEYDHERLPGVEDVEAALIEGIGKNPNIAYITFSGNGEPTIHPDFPGLVGMVIKTRDGLIPSAKTAILSNSATVSRPDIVAALDRLDCRFMKLDCGDEKTFRRYNRCHKSITFDGVISGLKNMRDIVIQALFAGGRHGNASDENIERWINAIGIIKPRECHIYSLDRTPADGSLVKLELADLNRIKEAAERKIGIPVKVF
jgi:wyosine [tRNA(Phe)-imidazoG37] synthetase (radical SAM superfamily)